MLGNFVSSGSILLAMGGGGEGGCVMGGICVSESIIKLNKHLLS